MFMLVSKSSFNVRFLNPGSAVVSGNMFRPNSDRPALCYAFAPHTGTASLLMLMSSLASVIPLSSPAVCERISAEWYLMFDRLFVARVAFQTSL